MGTPPPTVLAPRDGSSSEPSRTGTASPRAAALPAGRTGEAPGFDLWSGDGPSVLLIEDDAGDALLVEEMVADSGVAIDLSWARTLAEALDALDRDTPSASCSTCTCPTPRDSAHWRRSSPARRTRPSSS